ncbi:uncharacterized protein [Henckelia pumila]|uniref:uncharacterized protein isoform X2 n=1 Tax=Henckelia pumila TaxID=405737 RepID=UPI003C6E8889
MYGRPHFDQLFKRTGSLYKSFEGMPKIVKPEKPSDVEISAPEPDPPDGGKKSYAAAFMASSPRTLKKSFLVGDEPMPALKEKVMYKNVSGIFFSEEEVQDMSNHNHFALIGKFSSGLPSKDRTLLAFSGLNFKF